jgi:hypothetical protein
MVVCEIRLYSCSSQYRVILSVLPTARHKSLGLKLMHCGWPVVETWIVLIVLLVLISHSLTVWSILPLAIIEESGEISRQVI